MQKSLQYSFEVFPPKTELVIQKKDNTWVALKKMQPKFISVTFGAGGSTQNQTIALVKHLKQKNIKVVPHLSCINLSKQSILDLLKLYKSLNIDRLVVIRGDLPPEQTEVTGDFHYASDLVAFIRENFTNQFKIFVAAYPEFHPEARDAKHDFANFCEKVSAGADAAITQYFFNSRAYCHFLNLCAKKNIKIPIIPGIMPIYNYEKLLHFSKICQADIPQWLKKSLHTYQNDEVSLKKFGVDVVCQLCEELLNNGAPAFHFYTLNQSEVVETILHRLGIVHTVLREEAL